MLCPRPLQTAGLLLGLPLQGGAQAGGSWRLGDSRLVTAPAVNRPRKAAAGGQDPRMEKHERESVCTAFRSPLALLHHSSSAAGWSP